jgi:hypothetical protein
MIHEKSHYVVVYMLANAKKVAQVFTAYPMPDNESSFGPLLIIN